MTMDNSRLDERVCQERDYVANARHDDIIQTIFAAGLNLDSCRLALRDSPDEAERRLGEATAGLNQAIADIRAYVLDLTHRVGDKADLHEATAELAQQHGRSTVPGHSPIDADTV